MTTTKFVFLHQGSPTYFREKIDVITNGGSLARQNPKRKIEIWAVPIPTSPIGAGPVQAQPQPER